MARRKNTKRIDPRYFLNETVNRNDDGSRLEEGLLDNIKSFVAKRSPGKALAHRIASNGGGAEGAFYAAADIDALAKGENKNSSSPLLKSLQRAWDDDPSLYRATIAQAVIDDIGEALTQPPSHRPKKRGPGSSEEDKLASRVYDTLDKAGQALLLKLWDETEASREYEGKTKDAAYAKEKAAREKGLAMDRDRRNRELDAWEDDQKAKKRAERDRKERQSRIDFDGGISGKSNWREE
jgi:hypothetical protein